MASTWANRLVSANTRVGVDTRKRENWASVATQTRETICRSDMIIGLGVPAVTNGAKWGDLMTGDAGRCVSSGVRHKIYDPMDLYRDMADEPWKYEDDLLDDLAPEEPF